ncbi:MAG: hypothetical protein Q4G58_11980 [bacterium]|nr:hypothetical protein [bacterium]
MISIKSKRKGIAPAYEEPKVQVPLEKREQLINGAIDLVNIIHQYVEKDGVGLTQLTKTSNFFVEQQEYNKDSRKLLNNLSEANDSLSDLLNLLDNVKLKKKDTIETIHSTLNSVSELLNELYNGCMEFKTSHFNILASIYQLQSCIEQCKNFTDPEHAPMQALIIQMEEEVKKLETSISIGYSRNDINLARLPQIKRNSIIYFEESTSVKEKLEYSLDKLDDFINQMNDISDKITEAVVINSYLDSSDQITSLALERLTNRKQENAIMLSDLISFLVQLKTILTYLKEEPANS